MTTTMTSIYRDPATYELLFMERNEDGRWIPCLDAMEAWRTATWRLYQTGPDDFVTMPHHQHWPLLPPAEEANIDHVLAHPWIPDGAALDVNEGDLPMTDLLIQLSGGDDHDGPPGPPGGGAVTAESAWSRTHMAEPQEAAPALLAALLEPATVHVHHTHHHVWDLLDTVARPALVWEHPFLLRERAPAPPLSAAALALRLLAAAAAEEQQQPQVAPMPKHVADLVIRDAETRGATCPISMEPIKVVDASVTSCGHVFQTEAIRHWLTSGHDTCPQCRQRCTV